MKLPVSCATTWRWMQTVGIYRDKFRQSYYNDKHEDPLVVEDRNRYIELMDRLSLRQPLWLQLSMHEFWGIKDRMPAPGLLLHHFSLDGAEMVEVHVDLDDSFDEHRAKLALGGRFSVRFPGRTPGDGALRSPPARLPAPGEGLTPAEPSADTDHVPQDGMAAEQPAAALPTLTAIRKMKVIELKAQLNALNLDSTGTKSVLLERLLGAVRERQVTTAEREQSDNDSDEEEWRVKKILSCRSSIRILDNISYDVIEYEVQWDWPDADDPSRDEVTWEREGNLTNAHGALHDFFASQPKHPGCEFNHIQGCCRCSLPLIHCGQDESIFKAYQKSQYQWVVKGIRGLRKKTDGPGEMVSGFKDEIRGFGHPLSQEELALLNAFRKARGREPLESSPAVRFLTYGKSKDGYWKYENFAEQVVDVLDMYEALYPNAQVLLEVDWSSGHSKHRDDALNVLAMGVNFGGKQAIPHNSMMVEGCLGQGALLKVGEVQHFYFRSIDERRDDGASDGQPDPPPFYKPDLQPSDYVGQAKGKKQVLFERGLWKAGMVERVDEDDPKGRDQSLSMDWVLSQCPDFRNETSALQKL